MPSVSPSQHRLMEGVAHGMKAKGKGPSKAVAKEFVKADEGKKVGKTTPSAEHVKRVASALGGYK